MIFNNNKIQITSYLKSYEINHFGFGILRSTSNKTSKQTEIAAFNHIIGLPTKGRIEKPIFDYEKLLYDSLLGNEYSNVLNHNFKHKHLWVKKATGLGVTEFFLRLMAWLCLRNNDYQDSHQEYLTMSN